MFRSVALLVMLAGAQIVEGRSTSSIQRSRNICSNSESCHFSFNIEKIFTMAYTDKTTGHLHAAVVDDFGNVMIPALDNKVVLPEDFSANNLVVLDGYPNRMVLTVNSRIPGPTIEVYQGTELTIRVSNLDGNGPSLGIHWHGMFQTTTPWMDGSTGISQCHIYPGSTFVYSFTADPWGTFWWHAFSGYQRNDGIFGHLVIHDKEVPDVFPEYQHDIFFVHVMEWMHEPSEDRWLKHLSDEQLGRDEYATIAFQSGLIGNRGVLLGQWFDQADEQDTNNVRRAGFLVNEFLVQRGDSYRFRWIGTGFNAVVRISIDEHTQTVISDDGFDIDPIPGVESFLLAPGDRIDTIVSCDKLPSQPLNYWIRADFAQSFDFSGIHHEIRAVLRYEEKQTNVQPVQPAGQAEEEEEEAIGNVDPINPWTDVSSQRTVCTAEAPCVVANCYQPQYPFGMVDGTVDLESGAYFGSNSTNIICTGLNDIRNIDLYKRDDDARYVNLTLPVQQEADETYFLSWAFDGTVSRTYFSPNIEPLLFNDSRVYKIRLCTDVEYDGKKLCYRDDGCSCANNYTLKNNQVFDFVWYNMKKDVTQCGSIPCALDNTDLDNCGIPDEDGECTSYETQVIHLHGHSFWVLHEGAGTIDEATGLTINNPAIECDEEEYCLRARYRDKPVLNLHDQPTLQDTIALPPGSFVHVRIRTDNPGNWALYNIIAHRQPTALMTLHENYSNETGKDDPKNFDEHRPDTGILQCGEIKKENQDCSMAPTLSLPGGDQLECSKAEAFISEIEAENADLLAQVHRLKTQLSDLPVEHHSQDVTTILMYSLVCVTFVLLVIVIFTIYCWFSSQDFQAMRRFSESMGHEKLEMSPASPTTTAAKDPLDALHTGINPILMPTITESDTQKDMYLTNNRSSMTYSRLQEKKQPLIINS